MTEKEKRDNGLLYDANYNEALTTELINCKDICFEYNNLKPSQAEKRTKILKSLFGKTKENLMIQSPFWCDYGYNIEVGENFYANHGCVILDGAKVTFGDNVFIGADTVVLPGVSTVGNNVWIGGGVQVLPGVTIGNNVVIGSGSVVTHNIPDNVVAVGNPCRVIRDITNNDIKKDYAFL